MSVSDSTSMHFDFLIVSKDSQSVLDLWDKTWRYTDNWEQMNCIGRASFGSPTDLSVGGGIAS